MSSSNNAADNANHTNTTPPRPGRPRALDDIKRAMIVTAVHAGFNIERAARYVGCAATTIHRECRRNPEFGRELDRAIFTSELAPLNAVREAAKKDWRAGIWLLERLNPELFARRNPSHIAPEHVTAVLESFIEILAKEVSNPDERQRVYDKINALNKSIERLARAQANTPPRRRSRRRARELNPNTTALLAEVEQRVEKEAKRLGLHKK